jgi:hypothetical protein
MKKIIALFLVGGVIGVNAVCPPTKMKTESSKTIKKDGWVLKIWVTAKGTRSEGRVSHLYHNGQEVCPSGNHMSISTPLGTLEYIDAPYRWGWHGWKQVDSAGK